MSANPVTSLTGFPLSLHLAKAGSASGRIEGYGSMFGGPPDCMGRIIEAGAFAGTLLAHKKAGTMPSMLWAHDSRMPIGKWVHMEEDNRGLHVVGEVNMATTRGRDIMAHLKAGDFNGLSIGWSVRFPTDIRRHADGGIDYLRVDLREISVCTIPANERARILDVASVSSERQFARLLHTAGFSKSVSVKLAAGGWSTLREGNPLNLDGDPARASDLLARVRAATAAIKP